MYVQVQIKEGIKLFKIKLFNLKRNRAFLTFVEKTDQVHTNFSFSDELRKSGGESSFFFFRTNVK